MTYFVMLGLAAPLHVEKCSKMQIGEEHPSITGNCNTFSSEGMGHKRGHTNQPRKLSQENGVYFHKKKLDPLRLSVHPC